MKTYIVRSLIKELIEELVRMQDSASPDLKQQLSKTVADLEALGETLAKETCK